MKIVLATKNRHKVEEIRAACSGLAVSLLSLPEGAELKEEGATLRDNALQKARAVAGQSREWALADDTGLFVEALDGRPGVFSARYGGFEKLLEEMKMVPMEKRGAHFSCVRALVHPDGREVTVEGRLAGEIAMEPKGEGGFGYDPVFRLTGQKQTLAELSMEEKNRISHRGLALCKIKGVLKSLVKDGV